MRIRKTYLSSLVLVLAGMAMCGAFVTGCVEIYEGYKDGIDVLAILFGITAAIVVVFSIIAIIFAGLYRADKIRKYNWFFLFMECVLITGLTLLGAFLRFKLVSNAVAYDIFIDYHDFNKIGMQLNETIMMDGEFIKTILLSPKYYAYGKIISILFGLFGYKAGIMLYINLFFQMFFYFFTYRIARSIGGRISAIIAYGVLILLPSQMSFNYMVEYNSFYLFVLSAGILLFLYIMRLEKKEAPKGLLFLLYGVLGLVLAYGLFIDIVTIIPITGILLYLFFLRDGGTIWNGLLRNLVLTGACVGMFLLLLYGKMSDLQISSNDVLQCYENEIWMDHAYYDQDVWELPGSVAENFYKVWKDDSYMDWSFQYFLPVENQMIYVEMLLFAFLGIIYLLKSRNSLAFPMAMFYLGIVTISILRPDSSYDHINAIPFVSVFAGITFQYLYRAYIVRPQKEVPDIMKKNVEIMEKPLEAESTLIDGSSLPDKKEENVKPIIKYIDNPLPVPKKHVAKSMDYDIEVSEDDDFDIDH